MVFRRAFSALVIILVTASSGVFVSCSTVAVSGRKQLNFIPSGEMMATSYQQYAQFKTENKLSSDATQTARLRAVGTRIQGAVETYFQSIGRAGDLKGYAWEFNLVESDDVNAWCMPGGKVVFYTGILPVCQTDLGIAVVMGHEVAHAVAEHGAERMSQSLLAEMGGTALSAALHSQPEKTQSLWMTAFGIGATYGALLPFSRTQESEADHLGLIFMAMAGYDPHEAESFWKRMSANSGGGAPPEFMSTHPSDETRIRKIQENMPEAMKYYKPR